MDELQRLQSTNVEERVAAAEALALMGPDAAFAAVELVEACGDDEMVREGAIAALESLGPPPTESMDRLAALTSDNNSLVAYWAITLLGRLGTEARACEDCLVNALTDSGDTSRCERAAWALGMIQAESAAAMGALEQATHSSKPRLSRLAQTSLDQIAT